MSIKMPASPQDSHRNLTQTSLIIIYTLPSTMSWLRNIFPCWGFREQRGPDSSAAQWGSKMDQGSDELTGLIGEMPPFEVKPKTVSIKYQ